MSRYFVKGAFAEARDVRGEEGAFARARGVRRGAGAWGVRWVQGAFAGASGVRRACGIVFGAFARGQGALFLGRSQGARGVRKGKKRVYDFFPADVRFFCKFEFYVHIHYYF